MYANIKWFALIKYAYLYIDTINAAISEEYEKRKVVELFKLFIMYANIEWWSLDMPIYILTQ